MHDQAPRSLQTRVIRWLPLGTGLFVLVVMCGLTNGVLQHRIGPAWSINLDLGPVQLIAGTSEFAQCPHLFPDMCSNESGLVEKTFAVWLIRHSRTKTGVNTSARRLMVYPRWVCQDRHCYLQHY